jgi:hypothetical protein
VESRNGDHRKAFAVSHASLALFSLESIAISEGKHTVPAEKKWAAAFGRHPNVPCPLVLVSNLWFFDLWFFSLWVFDL